MICKSLSCHRERSFSTVGLASVLTLLLLSGCGQETSSVPGTARPVANAVAGQKADATKPAEVEVAAPGAARKIVYTSQIEIIVEDLSLAQQRMTKLINAVQEKGGYLSHQEITGTAGYQRRGTWTIRIPLAQFEGFVVEIETLGELERNSRDAQDVTEAYTDLEARLRNKKSSEERLLSHLAKASELKDTLELEREISRVRGEVEQLQGQLNVLKNKSDLATVTVTLTERKGYVPPTKPTFGTLVSRTFFNSWQGLVTFGQALALIAVALFPWLVVLGIAWLIVWVFLRMQRAQRG